MSTAKKPTPAAAPAEAPPEKKKGKSVLLLAVIGLVVLGGLGAGGWFLAPKFLGARPEAAEAKPKAEEVKATVALGSVVVNLAGEPRRYLRVAASLGVPGSKEVKEVEEAKAQVLDLLISVLGGADLDTLLSDDGRADLKAELLERVRAELGLTKVAKLYFTEFLVQ